MKSSIEASNGFSEGGVLLVIFEIGPRCEVLLFIPVCVLFGFTRSKRRLSNSSTRLTDRRSSVRETFFSLCARLGRQAQSRGLPGMLSLCVLSTLVAICPCTVGSQPAYALLLCPLSCYYNPWLDASCCCTSTWSATVIPCPSACCRGSCTGALKAQTVIHTCYRGLTPPTTIVQQEPMRLFGAVVVSAEFEGHRAVHCLQAEAKNPTREQNREV